MHPPCQTPGPPSIFLVNSLPTRDLYCDSALDSQALMKSPVHDRTHSSSPAVYEIIQVRPQARRASATAISPPQPGDGIHPRGGAATINTTQGMTAPPHFLERRVLPLPMPRLRTGLISAPPHTPVTKSPPQPTRAGSSRVGSSRNSDEALFSRDLPFSRRRVREPDTSACRPRCLNLEQGRFRTPEASLRTGPRDS